MESIVYIISLISLFILYTLLKKKEETENIIKHITINIVLLLCYNCFICWLYNVVKIPINLITLSIFNYILSIVFFIKIYKSKQIQKYSVSGKNIVITLIILGVTITTAIFNFTTNFNIKYLATDASVHYKAAKEFYQNDMLLNNTENTQSSKQFMTAAYTNTGIIFKVLVPYINEIDLYKIFIIFDILLYCMQGLLIYIIIEKIIKTKFAYILSVICILLFVIGYPLNSLIFGYTYFSFGLMVIETIILLFQKLNNKNNKVNVIASLFLLNFTLFSSYLLFVPVMYLAEGLYILKKYKKEKNKLFNKESIFIIFITLIIPFIIGLLYYVLFKESGSEVLTVEGYIFRNYWSISLILLPISILCFKDKNEDLNFLKLVFLSLMLVMIVAILGVKYLNVSTYYYAKYNFLLWLILWIGVLYTINICFEKKQLRFQMVLYVLVYLTFTGLKIYSGTAVNKESWPQENLSNCFDIYGLNKTIINDIGPDLIPEEIELYRYVYNNIDVKQDRIFILANPRQECWFDGMFLYKNREDIQTRIPQQHIDDWNNNKTFKYALVFYDAYMYNDYKDIFSNDKLIFENETGVIYENY